MGVMWPEGPWGRAGWRSKASRGRKVLRTGQRGVSRADRSCVSPSTSEGQAGVAGAERWPGLLGTGREMPEQPQDPRLGAELPTLRFGPLKNGSMCWGCFSRAPHQTGISVLGGQTTLWLWDSQAWVFSHLRGMARFPKATKARSWLLQSTTLSAYLSVCASDTQP